MYIHEDTQVDQVNITCKNVLTLRVTQHNVFIVITYRPPSYTVTENQGMIEALHTFMSLNETILMGTSIFQN